MKKKVLFSIVAVALFAVAMAFNSQKDENEDLTVKNIEALAQTVEVGTPCINIDGYQCYDECPECGDGLLIIAHPEESF
jgi:uncharacterized alpha/beta hydrolase family protein